MSGELAGRVIAITGATGGIGRALCLAAAAEGAQLVLLARNERKLRALHAELEQIVPGKALMAPLDLEKAVAADYDRIAAAIEQQYGRLDGLVHCAALLGTLTPIDQYDVPAWCRVLHVNLTAAFALTQVLLPALRKSADASIIFTSSGVGRRGRAYWGAYAVSKFAVEGFMQVLADELAGNSTVRVNAINPGKVRTTMRRQAYPSENLLSLPLPETVVEPYIRLLGPRGAGITGQSLDCQSAVSASPA
ncbi:MAG: YciK family oxidoreductase [Proteobacteria bacterium]|jgi:NAD(P)-dependent dehydrogenase (short-subunit alcohol dehydrogenase family)|nr:YciK family oxidoreductase [Pseudomonadota bacterium]MCC6631954.1 YciK family oxidoreductase [Gammaproteobacteria bacterium]